MSTYKKTKVLKLQYSDNGGVMTKIIGNQTGDHSIQLLQLQRNVRSIREESFDLVMLETAGLLHILFPCGQKDQIFVRNFFQISQKISKSNLKSTYLHLRKDSKSHLFLKCSSIKIFYSIRVRKSQKQFLLASILQKNIKKLS